MPNQTINALIEEKIDIFQAAFRQTAKVVFRDEGKRNKLMHPGEFGTYREAIVADLISAFLPQKLEIDTGFIVNANDGISGQIDLIVYDPSLTPTLESKNRQRFFPIETVVAVGEVRSDISPERLTDGLRRLAKVKALRAEETPERSTVQRWSGLGNTDYDPRRIPFDQVFSFLICNRFTFPFHKTIKSTLDSAYGDTPYDFRHNAILSVQNGLLRYSGSLPNGEKADTHFPTSPFTGERNLNKWLRPEENPYYPLKSFCSDLFMHTSYCTIAHPDLSRYFTAGLHHFWIEKASRQNLDPKA
jgi:hypothetical protein